MRKGRTILKNKKGFTLVELLAVIVILGIIGAIAVPAIGNIIDDSEEDAVYAEAISILEGARLAKVNDDMGTDGEIDVSDLESSGYVENVSDGFDDATITEGDNGALSISEVTVDDVTVAGTIDDINAIREGTQEEG
ncbi:type IV pilus assembly protein PilA [Salinibacillus kushneri]|uniref:Type IV pilus assembly protein PilA n=1 Tax=Salinibacillus kushneri TaxID=237682 RepID=A0A1I0GLS6_9BACI|nr:type II secretion system protein [Salinibacillus kushneri]SET72199.1 type IV pilus assembly protein PilA [Salinibacillus kushneri]